MSLLLYIFFSILNLSCASPLTLSKCNLELVMTPLKLYVRRLALNWVVWLIIPNILIVLSRMTSERAVLSVKPKHLLTFNTFWKPRQVLIQTLLNVSSLHCRTLSHKLHRKAESLWGNEAAWAHAQTESAAAARGASQPGNKLQAKIRHRFTHFFPPVGWQWQRFFMLIPIRIFH